MEGSVRRTGERIRINSQLIEATTGKHLWAQSYDRELKEVFNVQDEITQNVVKSVLVKLAFGEASAVTTIGTKNIEAWEAAVQGRWHYWHLTREGNAQARRLYQKALRLDPQFALMYVAMGQTYYQDGRRKYSKDPAASFNKAEEFLQKAIAMDDSLATAYHLLGSLYLTKGEQEKALVAVRRSVELAPDDPFMLAFLARMLVKVGGSAQEAVEMAEKAVRLHPRSQHWIHRMLIRAYYYAGEYNKAATAANKYLQRDPEYFTIRINLVASLAAAGREEEARAEADKMTEEKPKFSAKHEADNGFFREVPNPKFKERYFNHLRQAGLPE